MSSDKREGAAGRQDTGEPEGAPPFNTLAHWLAERIWKGYRTIVVFGNTPKEVWFPPSEDGSSPGVLVARGEMETTRFFAEVDPISPVTPDAGGPARVILPATWLKQAQTAFPGIHEMQWPQAPNPALDGIGGRRKVVGHGQG